VRVPIGGGLSAARRLIEGFAPRHAGIGQGACLCELTSTDLLQCADSAHWMVTGAECDRGGRCAADPAATSARSWADRPSVSSGWRRWQLKPQYVIAHVSIDTEMVSAVAFDTTIIEISLLR
jgi:hypothetical protein